MLSQRASFVSKGRLRLLQIQPHRCAQAAWKGNIKIKILLHPLCVRHVELASTLSMPTSCARIVRRASIKRCQQQQHTCASFVSKARLRLFQIQPRRFAQAVWKGSIRIKIRLHPLCVRHVELASTLLMPPLPAKIVRWASMRME